MYEQRAHGIIAQRQQAARFTRRAWQSQQTSHTTWRPSHLARHGDNHTAQCPVMRVRRRCSRHEHEGARR